MFIPFFWFAGKPKKRTVNALQAFKKKNDPIRNKIWLKNHFLQNPIYNSRYDVDIWVTGKNSWFIADRKGKKIYFNKNINEIISFLKTEKGKKIVVNLHPDYFE